MAAQPALQYIPISRWYPHCTTGIFWRNSSTGPPHLRAAHMMCRPLAVRRSRGPNRVSSSTMRRSSCAGIMKPTNGPSGISIYLSIGTYIYVCVCVYIYIYVCVYHWWVYDGLCIIWVKECHKPPMTGNGLNPTCKHGDLEDGLLLFYPH